MLRIFINISILLLIYGIHIVEGKEMIHRSQINKPLEAIAIAHVESNVTIECYSCNVNHLQWTYKSRNGAQEEIIKRNKVIRSKNHGKRAQWYNLLDDPNCTYNLFLPKIQYDASGVYGCWDNTAELRLRNIIVLTDVDNMCFIEEYSGSDVNIFLKQNDSVTIKCSFQYSADESCIVTPVWTDLTGYRDFTIAGDDFEVNMDDDHAWIHFKPGADLRNGTHLSLSFIFNCSSFKNNSRVKHIQAKYDFGHAPFTILLDGDDNLNSKASTEFTELGSHTELNETVSNAFNPLTVWILITAVIILILIVSLVLVCLKHHSKLCFAANNEQAKHESCSVLGNVLPDVPMNVSDARYIQIDEDMLFKDVRTYEVIDDGTYDAITEPLELTFSGNSK